MDADWPEVTIADVFADQQFFYDHPERRYRARPAADGRVWIVYRRGLKRDMKRRSHDDVFLRTLAQSPLRCPDTDEALRRVWLDTARPAGRR